MAQCPHRTNYYRFGEKIQLYDGEVYYTPLLFTVSFPGQMVQYAPRKCMNIDKTVGPIGPTLGWNRLTNLKLQSLHLHKGPKYLHIGPKWIKLIWIGWVAKRDPPVIQSVTFAIPIVSSPIFHHGRRRLTPDFPLLSDALSSSTFLPVGRHSLAPDVPPFWHSCIGPISIPFDDFWWRRTNTLGQLGDGRRQKNGILQSLSRSSVFLTYPPLPHYLMKAAANTFFFSPLRD